MSFTTSLLKLSCYKLLNQLLKWQIVSLYNLFYTFFFLMFIWWIFAGTSQRWSKYPDLHKRPILSCWYTRYISEKYFLNHRTFFKKYQNNVLAHFRNNFFFLKLIVIKHFGIMNIYGWYTSQILISKFICVYLLYFI